MQSTPDTDNTVINYEAKVPQTANQPGEDTTNFWKAIERNTDVTQFLNAAQVSGVAVPSTPQETRSIDPLLLAKTHQHHASFANTYEVDSFTTTTPPADIKHIIKLISSSRSLDVKQAIINNITPTPPSTIPYSPEIRTIAASVDAQPFDGLPNGAEFNFITPQTNTLSAIDIQYEFKHLKYNSTTKQQESETITLTRPLKDVTGTTDIDIGILRTQSRITIVFDKNLGVFKLVSVTNNEKPLQLSDILQTQQRIALSYNSPTSLNYSAGGFIFDDFSGSGFVNAGTVNLTGLTANASWYIFAIANPTTGGAQIQHYNSLTPTLPTGFTKKKLLFAFITNANSQLRAMKIHNLPNAYKVEYLTNIQEYLNYAVPIAGELKTFTVPLGIEVEVEGSYRKNNHGANNIAIGFTHPSKLSFANDGTFFSYTGSAAGSYDFGASFKSFTNTNRQIRISTTGSNGGPTGLDIIYTWGYTIYL